MQEPVPGIFRTDNELRWKDRKVAFFEVEVAGKTSRLKEFYQFMYHWHNVENFVHWQTKDSRPEDFYLQRMKQDGVQENVIFWRTVKNVNKYITYFNKLDWQVNAFKPTEVMYNGKKVKAGKLAMVVRSWWYVQIDPFNKWEKSFLGGMAKWFYEHLLSTDLKYHEDKCREIAKRQEQEIKQFFELSTDKQMPRQFFGESGYKWERPKAEAEEFSNQMRQPDHKI